MGRKMPNNSEIKTPFDAYDGDEPYTFVSYARDDKNLVYGTLKK